MQARTCYTHWEEQVFGVNVLSCIWALTQCPHFLVSSHQIICGLLSDRSYKVFVYTPYVLRVPQFLQQLFDIHGTVCVRRMAAL